MQSNKEESQAIHIAMGWVMLLLILTISLVVLVVHGIVVNDQFTTIRQDPGPMGLMMIVYLFGIYAVMPIVVQITQRSGITALRWVVLALTVLLFAFFALHHLSHWQAGDRPTFNSHVLELAHHAIALWVIFLTFRWARSPARALSGATA